MDTVRVIPGIFPPTINTTPNSPTVWAKLRTMPVVSPLTESGIVTRKNVSHLEMPRVQDASNSLESTAAKADEKGWTANGKLYNTEAINRPSNVKGRVDPIKDSYHFPRGLLGPKETRT